MKFKALVSFMLIIGIVVATHNPTVSHPASAITNSTFLDNYTVNGTFNFTFNTYFSTFSILDAVNNRFGLGTFSPTYYLHVLGNVSLNNSLYVTTAGLIGINLISPVERLHLNGTFRIDNSTGTQIFLPNATSGNIDARNLNISTLLQIQSGTTLLGFDNALRLSYANLTGTPSIGYVNLTGTAFIGYANLTGTAVLSASNVTGLNNALTLNASNVTSGTFSGDFSFANNISGNVSFDASTLFVDSTNNRVGIGTTSPDKKLHVVGDANISGNLLMGTNRINFTEFVLRGLGGWAAIRTETASAYEGLYAAGIILSADENYVQFADDGYAGISSTAERIIFDSSGDDIDIMGGNVGIGTIVPNSTLHVVANGTGGGFRVTNQSNAAEVFFVNSTLGSVGIGTTTLEGTGLTNNQGANDNTIF